MLNKVCISKSKLVFRSSLIECGLFISCGAIHAHFIEIYQNILTMIIAFVIP